MGELLTHYVELAQPIEQKQLELLVAKTPCPPERMELVKWQQKEAYQTEVLDKRLSLFNVLQRFGSCSISFDVFLSLLPPMQVRQYSISSSSFLQPNQCSLTVAVVDSPAWSGQGTYQGLASNYLANLEEGDFLWCMVSPSKFHLPANPRQPVIMVGAGSGIAPFRGFIQKGNYLLDVFN